jgi:hypothetical protein
MAPKKDKGKAAPVSDVVSLYVKREPLAPPEAPNTEEVEDAWKVSRDSFLCPLPEWDAERVDTTEWNPNEVETLYTNEAFSAKLLPKPFAQHISAWKRAGSVSDNTASEEQTPEAKPPEPPPEPVVEVDPKAKGKAKPADKGKGGKDAPVSAATTAVQFAEVNYTGDACVVSPGEFRTRLFELTNDDGMPPLSQAISAQIAIVGEHYRIMPQGSFLWELIYPQNEDGVPLYNPHGKYIVKLYVQGKWREVVVDDIVPVGSASGSASLHAPVLPAATGSAIWTMILSKALLRAFNHDLKAPIIPAVQALTGMSLFTNPLTWQSLRSFYESRPYCCLQMSSKVDIEARQREALMAASPEVDTSQKDGRGKKEGRNKGSTSAGSTGIPAMPALNLGAGGVVGSFGPQVPKLGSHPVDALLQFLVCEVEDEPPQIRMKSATWRPTGGTPRKVILDVAESEGENEEDDLPRADQEDRQSDAEDHDDEEDEDRRSQRSPSGENTVPSARSKEEPTGEDGVAGGDSTENAEEVKPPGAVWPSNYFSSLMPKSESLDYHDMLLGGYWVGLEVLEQVCDSFICYLPPGTSSLSAQLDTSWELSKRSEPYAPSPMRLLRVLLSPAQLDLDLEPTPRGGDDMDELATPRERGPPWHKATLLYEPVRLDPSVTPSAPIAGPGSASSSCILQKINHWNPSETSDGGQQYINLSVTETGGASASRSVLLPTGENWYLVMDEAVKAGSVLSAHVDNAMLSKSNSCLEFVDPCVFLPEMGIAMAAVGTTEYSAQMGFSVWAKAEVVINAPGARENLQLMSYISDPALRANLRVSLLRLEQETCEDAAQRCALWSVTALTRVPLAPLMSLPLGKPAEQPDDVSVKYILMLEANVPSVAKGGTFSLNALLPPTEGPLKKPAEEEAPLLQLVNLTVDQVTRWSGEIAPNEKGIVLRERIVVPHGNGDGTATIRVTVTGLPKVVLNAQLMAQLQPTPQMRSAGAADGATPEPFEPGALIDPKEYGGRSNWLASKRTVAEESGMERVMFLHVLLCEGSTYLLDVFVDPYKGPDTLEGGQWTVEMFGSSTDIEIGGDTMEQDLEALVRKSWEETIADAPPVPRSERANKTRRRWLKKRGLGGDDDEDLEEPAPDAKKADAKAEAKAKPKAKGKGEEPVEPEIDPVVQEAEWLADALKRAGVAQHSNVIVDEFVHVHTDVEPTLIEEDPYTIAPVLDSMFDEDAADAAAIRGLGMKGSAEVAQGVLEFTIEKWEKIQEEVTAAKERNAQALVDLTKWSEDNAVAEPKFKELRETMREGLQLRYQAKEALKALVGDAEKLDPADLQTALDEAEAQEVSVWDEELVTTGGQKKMLIEDFGALKDRLSRLEAEPLVDEESREALSKLSTSVGQLQKQLKEKKLPLPEDMLEKELLQQASAAIAAAIALAEGDDAPEGEGS